MAGHAIFESVVRAEPGLAAGDEIRACRWTGAALAALLAFGFFALWAPRFWPVSVVQVGIFALALGWTAGAALGRLRLALHPLMIPLAGAVLVGCAQLAFGTSAYPWATEVATLDWFTRLAVFTVAFQAGRHPRVAERLLRGLLWFALGIALAAVLQRFTTPDRIFWIFPTDSETAMGPFVYHNQFAQFIETVLPIALFGAVANPRRAWSHLLMAAAFFASTVVAVSRAGVALALLETAAVLAVLRRKAGRRVLLAAAGLAGLAAVFVLAVGWEPLWQKFQRRDQLAERRLLYASTLEMIAARPGMGFGLGAWSAVYPAYARFDDGKRDNQAHSDWLQWAAEGGLPMLALMLALAAVITKAAWRTVWGLGLIAVLLNALVDYPFQQRPVFGYYFFALAGLVCAAAAQHRAERAGEDVDVQPD